MGDWRSFRAKLIAVETGQESTLSWEASDCAPNRNLLKEQNPRLAQEDIWAHATPCGPETGGLLLATPAAPAMLRNAQWWQQVVLLLQHGPSGSLGLLLNRPTSLVMGRGRGGLPVDLHGAAGSAEIRAAFAANRLYCGGPRAQAGVHLLHGYGRFAGAVEVCPGVFVGGEEDACLEVAAGSVKPVEFKFFAGVTAWAPGQLQAEVEAGAWWPAAASRTLVLKQCLMLPVPLWEEVAIRMGGEFAAQARAQRGQGD